MRKVLLEVKDLKTRFHLVQHSITAVDTISFKMEESEILAVVGESGCGKSVTSLSIMNLIEKPGVIDPNSKILFNKTNLLSLSEKEISEVRGNQIAMIFQEPSASFNVLFRIGFQIGESLRLHKKFAKEQAYREAVALLKKVKISEAEKRVNDFPFQLSGGMLQRTMIALALSCSPRLLIADEPTTALDVTIQAQVMGLLKEQSKKNNMAILLITHDLELIDGFAHNVMIMYAGRIFEYGSVADIQNKALHPYTNDLLKAIPKMGYFKDDNSLYSIKGNVPELTNLPEGCKYAPRCQQCFARCIQEEPPLIQKKERKVRCWLFADK